MIQFCLILMDLLLFLSISTIGQVEYYLPRKYGYSGPKILKKKNVFLTVI